MTANHTVQLVRTSMGRYMSVCENCTWTSGIKSKTRAIAAGEKHLKDSNK